MPATVTSISSRPTLPGRAPEPPRRPFRDNPRLILAGIVVLLVALAALMLVARGSRFSPDFLSEFVLYALSAGDLTMLAALLFVLARNVIKLFVERRRALPFARFRAKLVLLLIGMTFVPSVLLLVVGSELISTSIERWFNAPMEEVLATANRIASDYYRERQRLVVEHAAHIVATLTAAELETSDAAALRERLMTEV